MSRSLTLSDASAPLLARRLNPPGSFPQSGSWSWVDLGKTTVQASIGVLQRYSAADIDTYTLLVGQIVVAGSFLFGSKGRRRVEEAITSLPSMRSLGKIIHFGFGIDSVIRSLATTEEGACLVVLCAAAAECYPEDQAASIMWEMVRCYEAPDSFRPSAIQWKALIRACAGSLSLSSFPEVAEHFFRLCSRGGGVPCDHPGIRSCSSSNSLAQALLGIGKVSTGELESITITGSSDAGWLAAIAEWMLDLRIVIVAFDGTLLHRNYDDTEQAHIRFLIDERNTEDSSKDLEIRTRTYHLQDYTDLLKTREGIKEQAIVCGRIPWSKALSATFGSYFNQFYQLKEAFGQALGSAARIFEAVKNAEFELDGYFTSNCSSYFASSYGKGFVNFACKRFPELNDFRPEMDQGASKSAEEALAAYRACCVIIASTCNCGECPAPGFRRSFCLVFILETILFMTRSLSGIEVTEGLDPLLIGLQAFYQRQRDLHTHVFRGGLAASERFKCMNFIIEGANRDEKLVIARLADAVRLFARGRAQGIAHPGDGAVSAITVGGITVFLDALIDISDDPERIGLCHVIPGRIHAHGRDFTNITDLDDLDPDGLDYRGKSRPAGSRDRIKISDLVDGYRNISLVASESVTSLRAGLCTIDSRLPRVILGLAGFTHRYLQSFGLVHCTCFESEAISSEAATSRTVEQLDEVDNCWHFQGTMISRLIALVIISDLRFRKIVRTQECLNCCKQMAAILGESYEGTLILSKSDY